MTRGLKKTTALYASIAFISGFAVLAVEIAGTRLVSGTLGNSIYTWSALIATVLLSLSIGSMAGGAWIDRRPQVKWLLVSLVFAAIATAIAPYVANIMHSEAASMSLVGGALFECSLIFVLPGFAFGAVAPICVKLLSVAAEGKQVGFSAGLISMAGSLGSFLGALVTPFWLIPNLSLTSLFLCLSGTVLLSSLLTLKLGPLTRAQASVISLIAIGLFIAGAAQRTQAAEAPFIFDQYTSYHRIRVEEQKVGGRTARFLHLDTTLEGGIVTGVSNLPLEYQNTWQLAQRWKLPVHRALCIGAGAFGVPQRLSQAYPNAVIDVAEIDPKVIEAGYKFFDLASFQRVVPQATDGRRFLSRSKDKYDLIFIDAYHGMRYIPPHLTTVEFFELCREHLADHGIVMMNVISGVSLDKGELLGAFSATVAKVFPACEFIPMNPMQLDQLQNVVLVCSTSALPETGGGRFFDVATVLTPQTVPLSDQKNPIEAILARQLRQTD